MPIDFPPEEYPERYELALKVVRDYLREEWDPIGVRDHPTAYDEYDRYAPGLTAMVLRQASYWKLEDRFIRILAGMSLDNEMKFKRLATAIPALIDRVERVQDAYEKYTNDG